MQQKIKKIVNKISEMKYCVGRTQVAKHYTELIAEQLRGSIPSEVLTVSATSSKSMANLLKPSDMSDNRSKRFHDGASGKVLKESNRKNKVKSSPIYSTQTITDNDGAMASKRRENMAFHNR